MSTTIDMSTMIFQLVMFLGPVLAVIGLIIMLTKRSNRMFELEDRMTRLEDELKQLRVELQQSKQE